MSTRGWLLGLLAAAAGIGLVWLEIRRPLRRSVEPKLRHDARNLAMAAVAALALQVAEYPLAFFVSRLADQHGWGLVPLLGLPRWLEFAMAVVLLDYTFYLWHILNH